VCKVFSAMAVVSALCHHQTET